MGDMIYELIMIFLRSWVVMLLVGVLHLHHIPQLPAYGYWTVFLVVFAVDIARGIGPADRRVMME